MTGLASYPSLAGKRVFVTGGATGIGAEIVATFAAQGAKVGFIDIDEPAGIALSESLNAASAGSALFTKTDASSPESLQTSIRDFATASGGLDVLINNVANDTRHEFRTTTPESWRKCLAVNLDAAFFSSQAAAEHMLDMGVIINLSSINALFGPPGMPGYVAAKAGLLGLTKALANELGGAGIRVNAVLPGWVVTERQLALWLTPESEAEWQKLTALKDRILPADVASLVLFLAADDSRMITGQHFVIDAGRT